MSNPKQAKPSVKSFFLRAENSQGYIQVMANTRYQTDLLKMGFVRSVGELPEPKASEPKK